MSTKTKSVTRSVSRSQGLTRKEDKSVTDPSTKRILSPEPQVAAIQQNHKKKKMSTIDFDEMKKLITQSYGAIESKITSSQTQLESKFDNLATNVNNEITSLKTCVIDLEKKVINDVNEIKLQLNNHTQRIDNNEDDLQRVQLSQDLRLTGFAHKDNENLLDIFNKIANEIGFEMSAGTSAPTLERIPIKNRTTGRFMPSSTIIIHFALRHQKQMFYSHYLNKMPLDPKKFGLREDNRIVLGENLTKKNASLFKNAQTLRKDKKIAQTFTEDGLVKIRFSKGKNENTHTIRNVIELETFVTQHEIALKANTTSNTSDSNATSSSSTAPEQMDVSTAQK